MRPTAPFDSSNVATGRRAREAIEVNHALHGSRRCGGCVVLGRGVNLDLEEVGTFIRIAGVGRTRDRLALTGSGAPPILLGAGV